MAGAMITVDGLHKGFNVRDMGSEAGGGSGGSNFMTVLQDVNFQVREGELVSLLGASGCGKTTLLRMLAGLIKPDRGIISIKGSRLQGPRKDLCMVFQNFSLLPWRPVLSNVAFPLELDGMGKAEREDVARHYIEIVGLKGFERHFPHELSGGMQQRVGIARALTRKPLVLLMDEPFGALDAQTRETLQEDFIKIWGQLKTTVVFVTHSIDESLMLSDRIIVFSSRPGRIKQTFAPPFASLRATEDVRVKPEFAAHAQEIRDLLRVERTA